MDWVNMISLGTGILATLLGLTFIWLGGQVSSLSCTRLETTRIDCQLQRQFLGAISANQQVLIKLSGTELKEDCDESCTYWIELLAEDKNIRLTPFSSYNQSAVQVEQQYIDDLLNNSDLTSFKHVSKPSWMLFLSGIPLIGVGGWLLLSQVRRKISPCCLP